ncbi:MAG: histidinol-phosphate transaminase [Fusobacteria bacterium]|nr:histidinol-phosphate transaminase [Fusobacteriota bacterium]
MKDIVNEYVKKLNPYEVPNLDYKVKLDANENPYEISNILEKDAFDQIKNEVFNTVWNFYPDASYDKLRDAIAKENNLSKENIILGNGSDEILLNLILTYINNEKKILVNTPTFSMYKILAQIVNSEAIEVNLTEEFELNTNEIISKLETENIALTFITYPNNPTGNLFKEDDVIRIIEKSKGIVVIDEAYYEFAKKSFVSKINEYKNIIVLRTFSKAYSIAGLRVGYMMSNEAIINDVNKVRLPYNLNKISEAIALKVYEKKEDFIPIIDEILSERDKMYNELKKIDTIKVFKSDTNSIFFKTEKAYDIYEELLKNKILIRKFSKELSNYLRFSIAKKDENEKVIKIIKKVLKK